MRIKAMLLCWFSADMMFTISQFCILALPINTKSEVYRNVIRSAGTLVKNPKKWHIKIDLMIVQK